MPALSNARRERFAQALAEGKGVEGAYTFAGFKPDRGNAFRLQQKDDIQQRVGELLKERASIQAEVTARAISKAALTKQWVIEKLMENVARALQATCVKDENGNPRGEYRYDGAVANRALELLGKEQGMFIDRKEIGLPGEFDGLSADELRDRLYREAEELGQGAVAAALAGGDGKARGKPH